jgi:hypothetical protein
MLKEGTRMTAYLRAAGLTLVMASAVVACAAFGSGAPTLPATADGVAPGSPPEAAPPEEVGDAADGGESEAAAAFVCPTGAFCDPFDRLGTDPIGPWSGVGGNAPLRSSSTTS